VLSALSPVEISGTEHNSVYGHVLAKLGLVAHQVKGPAVTPGQTPFGPKPLSQEGPCGKAQALTGPG